MMYDTCAGHGINNDLRFNHIWWIITLLSCPIVHWAVTVIKSMFGGSLDVGQQPQLLIYDAMMGRPPWYMGDKGQISIRLFVDQSENFN